MKLPKVPNFRHFSPMETVTTSALINNNILSAPKPPNCRVKSMPATVLCAYPVWCMLHSRPNSFLLITGTIDGSSPFKASWCLNTLSWFLHSYTPWLLIIPLNCLEIFFFCHIVNSFWLSCSLVCLFMLVYSQLIILDFSVLLLLLCS